MKIKYPEKPPEPKLVFNDLAPGDAFSSCDNLITVYMKTNVHEGRNCVRVTDGRLMTEDGYASVVKLETILEIIK